MAEKKTGFFSGVKLSACAAAFAASVFLAFGMYHIHAPSDITEGGTLGLILLAEHWLHISPALSGLVLNLLCYGIGWKIMGKHFLVLSAVAAGGFSIGYRIFEQFPHLWPQIAGYPLAAAMAGAVFVGVGTGICIRAGGAICGDDALAMSISRVLKCRIQWVYLVSDLAVLLLSLSYISPKRILYSLVTVVLSGQIIGLLQKK